MRLSPALLFLLVWLVPLTAPLFVQSDVIAAISQPTLWLVLGSIAMLFVLQFVARGAVGTPRSDLAALLVQALDPRRVERTTLFLFKLWLAVYAVNIVFSGGVPIYWVLTGDERIYADFGLPTLGGLANMLRAFVLAACYLVYFHLRTPRRALFLKIGAFLVFTAFVVETGRGNGVVMLLHPVGLHFLLRKVRIRTVAGWFAFFVAFALVLGYIQALRYGGDLDTLVQFARNSGFEDVDLLTLLVLPTILYMAVPIVNTDLNVALMPALKFEPYYSLAGVLPTVVRDAIFGVGDYGELVSVSHNVSSFFIPFVRDYGTVGAFFAVTLIHAVVCYAYAKAMRGSLVHMILWPALFMSVTLTFFSLFYTSLVVLLYPFLAWYFVRTTRWRTPHPTPT